VPACAGAAAGLYHSIGGLVSFREIFVTLNATLFAARRERNGQCRPLQQGDRRALFIASVPNSALPADID
jgi:hypothetical protein